MARKPKASLEDQKLDREVSSLYQNRYNRFENIFPKGWSKTELKKFANSTIHPTEAQNIMDKGCPPELVGKILL